MAMMCAVFKIIITLAAVPTVIGCGTHCHPRTQQIFHAAENRALRQFAYANKTVRSLVFCGRECSMDETCKSFNFYKCNRQCQLNNMTRINHSDDFNETQGSVYFDANEDTPLFSLPDSSLDRKRSCKMLLNAGYCSSGVYTIYPGGISDGGIQVYCDMESEGGGWTVFQRRQDGSVDFYRNWTDYQAGFGDVSGEFWLGNDNLVKLTSDDSRGTWELRVDLEDWDNNTAWAKYADFSIMQELYTLNIGQYDVSSTAGDSLWNIKGYPFSTKDRDNDGYSTGNCANGRKAVR